MGNDRTTLLCFFFFFFEIFSLVSHYFFLGGGGLLVHGGISHCKDKDPVIHHPQPFTGLHDSRGS